MLMLHHAVCDVKKAKLTVAMICFFDEDEDVDAEESREHHHHVQDGASGQDHSERADLPREQLVVEGRVAEVGVLLYLVEALGAPVDGCLGQRHQERHQNERQNSENEH